MSNPCYVPLRSDKIHYWLLARTDRDNTNAEGVKDTAKAVLTKWFSEVFFRDGWMYFPGKTPSTGKIDNVSIEVLGRHKFEPQVPHKFPVVADWQKCRDQTIYLRGETVEPWWVLVSFVWRGSDASLTQWPGLRSQYVRTWTAENADWILAKAWIDDAAPSPKEQNLGDAGAIIVNTAGETLGDVAAGTAKALSPLVTTVAVLGGAGLLGYWLFQRSTK